MTDLLLAASVWGALAVGLIVWVREGRRRERAQTRARLLALFGPALARAAREPRELVAWAGVARTARSLFPDAFRSLDAASGHRFPFSNDFIEGVHARWTSEWLAWEREHDLEYKRRVREAEAALEGAASGEAERLRGRLAEIEQEKLQRYQERYEEYVRIGRAVTELSGTG